MTQTRIRHFRRLRGMTQSELAHRIGTTAATVSRLETSDMTVSMDWLAKFADALDVQVADLISTPPRAASIPCIGQIGRDGHFESVLPAGDETLTLESPARNPVALRIRANIGLYCAGDVVIADRLSPEHAARALGRDCIVEVDGEESGFGRFISSVDGDYFLVPPQSGAQARSLPRSGWVAPVVMLIRYL
ncbi:helix-turn-helix domain-containing protein [Parvibaculum sedimenti]|uniref:Helix-turn-helix domain-containing protein n=1 Tax=Parvibaculum sedimenti TaxID=2608632 RepID=A0A6N6VK90_9HYPH|nr:helix-turn-helix transcriptional regulator [Parvibaculum sedimenti]KAB7741633.1 helix-turn-helix domain-containing protein [Parvibaculum sedimenti]